MYEYISDIKCLTDWSLFDALQALRRSGARDEYQFLMTLSMKTPLLADVGRDIAERFLACDGKSFPSRDGQPLLLCAITDGVAVGFPSHSVWSRDRIAVKFEEELSDGTTVEALEEIDNMTYISHAQAIHRRHLEYLTLEIDSPGELWNRREQVFPNLLFGPDVKRHLSSLDPGLTRAVVIRLKRLDEVSAAWRRSTAAIPTWGDSVTYESESVMKNDRLREARRFKSVRGTRELFIWHAKLRDARRIHLRLDHPRRELEIGYIGEHLATVRFRT